MAIIRKFNRSASTDGGIYNTSDDVLKLIRDKNIQTVPLAVEKLAEALGLYIRYESLNNEIPGALKREISDNSNKWIIYINNKYPKTRQRFTIAHEIAHYCLHRYKKTSFEDVVFFRGIAVSSEEYATNKFAGEILMPESIFREQIKNGMTKISNLADYFGVSALALRVRAKYLGLEGHGL
jgi:Zn-dependent peptidase ImmA (M78 family)